jgi:uncharacterized protein YjgD (DUF1641 family)
MENDLVLLHQKIDMLTEQISILTSQAEEQRRRQQALDELKDDMIPIANHMIKLGIDELAEIGDKFQLEDLFFVLKRVMRNTHLILDMFDRLEAVMGIADETAILGKQVFNHAVEQLDKFEREGYFDFAQEGWNIVERINAEFSKDDVRALGDNIVIILNTVRNMTQPEIMSLANNAVGAIKKEIPETEKVSLWVLLRELSNPKVRRGMARMINLLKALDDQSEYEN